MDTDSGTRAMDPGRPRQNDPTGGAPAEEERELLRLQRTALDLVAAMRAKLSTFKERLEGGQLADAELLAEANRIGFVVEYLAHSHH